MDSKNPSLRGERLQTANAKERDQKEVKWKKAKGTETMDTCLHK